MDGEPDRTPLVRQRAGDRLANPPGRVRRQLEAERVVELLDRPDQAEVALLDQVEERHAGLRVVARDRHHETQVRLDQLPLRGLVAEVLEPRELALLRGGQQRAVADLADVQLEGVGRLWLRRLCLHGVDLVDVGGRRNDLELGLGCVGLGESLRERPLLHHAGSIGVDPPSLEGGAPARGIRLACVEPTGTGMPNSQPKPSSDSVAAVPVAGFVQGVF
jgi:hypothetical protein